MSRATVTPKDIVAAAMDVAEDITTGKLRPADVEAAALRELRGLVDVDAEPDSELAALQAAVARRALAAGLIPAAEVAEWASVALSRSGDPDMPTDA